VRIRQDIYYEDYPRSRSRRSLDRRRHRPLARALDSPLKLLVLVAIGAGVAHFVPSLLCILLQFGSVLLFGLVVYWVWTLFRR
jgi:Flp pilus assembly protein TadB